VLQHFPGLRDAFRKFPADDWVRLAASVRVPIAHVLSPAEALSDARYLADGCVVEVDDPEQGAVRQCGIVYHLDTSPGHVQGPPPTVGQHTAEVRAEGDGPAEHRTTADPVNIERGRGPLAGIRVLDFGAATAGPFGAQLLSDLGADVIRINAPNQDFLIGHQFICAGRGKRAISINLKDPRGRQIVHRLVENSDVVHLNIGQNTVKRLEIDYDTLRAINPRLVYCHTGGYERSDRSNQPSNDPVACSVGGVNWADGGADDGGPPFWSVTAVGDTGNGFLSAIAVVQALFERERTGMGQHVDTSLVYACLLNTSYTYLREDGTEGEEHKVDRDQMGLGALYGLYETSNGWLCLTAVTEGQWSALGHAIERDDMLQDPRFRTPAERHANDEDLRAELARTFMKQTADEWFLLLDKAAVPVEVSDPMWPVRMFDDPELVERGWVVEYQHPTLGRFNQHGILFDFSDTPSRVAGRPPMLGEHTAEILTELGYAPSDIDQLERDGVVQRSASET
jgi:crotonobetainyl-CoA:carnitine CoA-transferase CaiB-like acyl-CoA transferase